MPKVSSNRKTVKKGNASRRQAKSGQAMSKLSTSSGASQNDALGPYFRAALSPDNCKLTAVRYLHDVPAKVAAFVRNTLSDQTIDDLDAYNEQGDGVASLQLIDWKAPGIFGPTGQTYYFEIIDEDAGSYGDYLLNNIGTLITSWSSE